MSPPQGKRRASGPGRPARPPEPLAALLDALDARADDLAERMLERYLSTIPTYRALPDETLRQVREVNRRNVRGFIRSMRRNKGPSAEELRFIRDSAERRAREGVPLSALLAAYRMGAQLAWVEAVSLVGDERDGLRAGLDLATAVMRWVDEVSGAVAQSYLEEYERLSSDREAARRDFLEGAISGALTAEEILARAEALGLDPAARPSVALIAVAQTEGDGALRSLQHRLRSMAADLPEAKRSLAVTRGAELVIVFPAENGEDAMIAALRTYVERASEQIGAAVTAGVGRARDSLAEVSGSYREASIALTATRGGSNAPVAVYGEVLVEELLLRERGVARRLAQVVLDPLAGHPDLYATLVEYIKSGPSLPTVAKRLFLHPNTVAYRLARVKELTGRDPKSPAGISELYLALRAADLVGTD